MPAQDPSSYTFKLSDSAGTNIYTPYGDGPATSGWRALPKSHNTMAPNASLQFSWKGTAITISGTVNSAQGPPGYMLSLDGQPATQELVDQGRAKEEILLSRTGLPLAHHTIVLSNIAGGNLTVKELDLTISTGANRTTWSDRSIAATVSSNSIYNPNPFFTFTGNWFPGKTSYSPPMLTTATGNSSSVLSFNLTKCSAFFLYGPMERDSGAPYNVKITPPVHNPNSSSLALNSTVGQGFSTASSAARDDVVFWESGMDRNLNYSVEISILPSVGQWGVNKLVIFDSTDQGLRDSSSSKTSGQVGGIIGGVVALFILCICVYACKSGGSSSSTPTRPVPTRPVTVTELWELKRVA